MEYLLVGAGGILGALARFALSKWMGNRFGASFPYGTFAINITGSFLLGFGVLFFLQNGVDWQRFFHLFINVGFLGAYTTFSTFSYEAFTLIEKGQQGRAWIYMAGSVVIGIVGAYLGMLVYTRIF